MKSELKVVRLGASEFGFGGQLFEMETTKDLQFFPAVNPKIHVNSKFQLSNVTLVNMK